MERTTIFDIAYYSLFSYFGYELYKMNTQEKPYRDPLFEKYQKYLRNAPPSEENEYRGVKYIITSGDISAQINKIDYECEINGYLDQKKEREKEFKKERINYAKWDYITTRMR